MKTAHLVFPESKGEFSREMTVLQTLAELNRRGHLDGALVDEKYNWPTLREYCNRHEIPERVISTGEDRVKAAADFAEKIGRGNIRIAYIANSESQQAKIDLVLALTKDHFDFAHRYTV